MFTTFVKMLPERQQLAAARWRFQKVREDFYRETRLDIAAKGLRNTETLFDRLETYEKRNRARGRLEWRVFARVRETMQRGERFALAIKPFIPGDEYALLDIADESSREDAVVRGFELAEMAAKAKRVLVFDDFGADGVPRVAAGLYVRSTACSSAASSFRK